MPHLIKIVLCHIMSFVSSQFNSNFAFHIIVWYDSIINSIANHSIVPPKVIATILLRPPKSKSHDLMSHCDCLVEVETSSAGCNVSISVLIYQGQQKFGSSARFSTALYWWVQFCFNSIIDVLEMKWKQKRHYFIVEIFFVYSYFGMLYFRSNLYLTTFLEPLPQQTIVLMYNVTDNPERSTFQRISSYDDHYISEKRTTQNKTEINMVIGYYYYNYV